VGASADEIANRPEAPHVQRTRYAVLYDAQCEICQACVSWLKVLDHQNKTYSLPISTEALAAIDSRLNLEECLQQLHVVTREGAIVVGWDAVACLARLFPPTWLIGALSQHFPLRGVGRSAYRFVAANRYALSKCRGGACRVVKTETVRRQARLRAFWSCYTLGFFLRLPLIVWAAVSTAGLRVSLFARTYHKRLELFDGKLTILFLNGLLPNAVPILFGELFTTVVYDGVAVDPGSPKMRRSRARHLHRWKPKISKIVATHAHEEHIGNLNWLSTQANAPIYVSKTTAEFLTPFKKLPWVRAAIIGQPPNLEQPYSSLGETLETSSGQLLVIATPGHCDDHVALYDAKEKVLLAGDAFMGLTSRRRILTWIAESASPAWSG